MGTGGREREREWRKYDTAMRHLGLRADQNVVILSESDFATDNGLSIDLTLNDIIHFFSVALEYLYRL